MKSIFIGFKKFMTGRGFHRDPVLTRVRIPKIFVITIYPYRKGMNMETITYSTFNTPNELNQEY